MRPQNHSYASRLPSLSPLDGAMPGNEQQAGGARGARHAFLALHPRGQNFRGNQTLCAGRTTPFYAMSFYPGTFAAAVRGCHTWSRLLIRVLRTVTHYGPEGTATVHATGGTDGLGNSADGTRGLNNFIGTESDAVVFLLVCPVPLIADFYAVRWFEVVSVFAGHAAGYGTQVSSREMMNVRIGVHSLPNKTVFVFVHGIRIP